VKTLFKKIKKLIMQGSYDIDTLIQIKSSLQSNKFQWIKTTDRNKVGKIVEVTDVMPGRNNRFLAVLSDGTQLDTDLVTSNLMMITDDQGPMSMDEVLSINYIPPISEGVKVSPDIPSDFAKEISLQKAMELAPPIKEDNSQTLTPVSKTGNTNELDLFGMFSLEDSDLDLTVKIKLPSKDLLKMMYLNSKNKDEFLTKLSYYINSNITDDSIKRTMKKLLSGSTHRKKLT
jgi:hypothetical protein